MGRTARGASARNAGYRVRRCEGRPRRLRRPSARASPAWPAKRILAPAAACRGGICGAHGVCRRRISAPEATRGRSGKHRPHEVFQLAWRLVVRHHPDAHARAVRRRHDDAAGVRVVRKRDAPCREPGPQLVPAARSVVVSIHEDAEGLPSLRRHLAADGVKQIRHAARRPNLESGDVLNSPVQVFYDMLVVLPFDEQQSLRILDQVTGPRFAVRRQL